MRTIPMKEDLIVEFKSDIKRYSDSDLIDEIVGMTNTKDSMETIRKTASKIISGIEDRCFEKNAE